MDVDHVSVCTQRRKCRMCKKLLVGLKEQKNTIAVMQCPSCKESVLISARKCFIQIGKSPEEKYEQKPQKRKKERTKVVRQQV